MAHIEESTLKAINVLSGKYPYAASLLCFVLIERELKDFLIRNRRSKPYVDSCVCVRGKCLRVGDYVEDSDEQFVRKFILKVSLGRMEELLGITKNKPSELRNDLMHSNRYIKSERMLVHNRRRKINLQKFDKAKKLLIQTFKKYSDFDIVRKSKELKFVPKNSSGR